MYNELIGDLIEALRPIEVTGDAATSMCLAMELSEAKAEIEQLKRERDAAVRLLQRECSTCLHWHPKTNKPCRLPKGQCSWLGREGWQWRGVKEGTEDG